MFPVLNGFPDRREVRITSAQIRVNPPQPNSSDIKPLLEQLLKQKLLPKGVIFPDKARMVAKPCRPLYEGNAINKIEAAVNAFKSSGNHAVLEEISNACCHLTPDANETIRLKCLMTVFKIILSYERKSKSITEVDLNCLKLLEQSVPLCNLDHKELELFFKIFELISEFTNGSKLLVESGILPKLISIGAKNKLINPETQESFLRVVNISVEKEDGVGELIKTDPFPLLKDLVMQKTLTEKNTDLLADIFIKLAVSELIVDKLSHPSTTMNNFIQGMFHLLSKIKGDKKELLIRRMLRYVKVTPIMTNHMAGAILSNAFNRTIEPLLNKAFAFSLAHALSTYNVNDDSKTVLNIVSAINAIIRNNGAKRLIKAGFVDILNKLRDDLKNDTNPILARELDEAIKSLNSYFQRCCTVC
ncbi:MAG: hypothetical protein ISQ13_00195 [Candidatus Margulisbacteria bacterium]|nr:hypothetical protein [Candidatus Margulisiibacteriota bacterium]